jgi:peptidoglycan/LPS O-acetylase OafA/YrhL
MRKILFACLFILVIWFLVKTYDFIGDLFFYISSLFVFFITGMLLVFNRTKNEKNYLNATLRFFLFLPFSFFLLHNFLEKNDSSYSVFLIVIVFLLGFILEYFNNSTKK